MVDRLPDHATIAAGGKRQGDVGLLLRADRRLRPAQDDELIQNEIFGPVITVQRFSDEDEALRWANGVRVRAGLERLDEGPRPRDADGASGSTSACVWINTHIPIVAEMPHGGFKHSGYGKDLSMYGLEDYTRIKHVMSYIGPSDVRILLVGAGGVGGAFAPSRRDATSSSRS